jgi:3-isopropylmalate/(R)-2-methylmalate dehydratase small subunit
VAQKHDETTMEKFVVHEGLVAPLDRANVDTDAIIPKQFLKSIKRTGFGPNLFDQWRYLDHGEPGVDSNTRQLNPEFVLNNPRYQDATILLAGKNFGCGSSREHAPWALQQYGFKAIIAPSFADIFFNNCFKIGLLPIILPESAVVDLFAVVKDEPGLRVSIDLEKQVIHSLSQHRPVEFPFAIDAYRKHSLLNGLDDIGLTLLHAAEITEFEKRRLAQHPWIGANA